MRKFVPVACVLLLAACAAVKPPARYEKLGGHATPGEYDQVRKACQSQATEFAGVPAADATYRFQYDQLHDSLFDNCMRSHDWYRQTGN